MKIICEYCKNTIDTDKERKCPNCMASYADNKEFKERINALKEEERLELERKKIQNETAKRVLETTKNITSIQKYVILIPIIFFLLIFLGIIISTVKNQREYRKIYTTKITTITPMVAEKKVTVALNEYAETSKYKVKVDKISNLDKLYGVLSPSEGKKFKVFHLIVENKAESTLILNDKINCIVDDFMQKETYYYSKYPALPYRIDALLKAEGYVIFEVPKNAKKYDIKYGNLVTIHIEE